MQIQLISIREIQPYQFNAKIHPEEQVSQIAKSIESYGFDQPIVVDKDMVIIKGHGRYLASLELGLTKVPVVVADHLTESQVIASRLADNKVSSQSYDSAMIRLEVEKIDLDANFTGFTVDEIYYTPEELEQPIEKAEDTPDKTAYKKNLVVLIACNDEDHQLVVMEELLGLGYNAKIPGE